VSFNPPNLTVLMVPNAPMHKMSILEVHLSHVPDVSSGNVLIPNSASLTAEGGYLNPAFYVNIVVKKRGNPDSDNLCDNLAFKVSSTGWLVGTCNLFAAPLQDVIVTLRVKDYWSGQWLTNDDTMVENRVFYRQPLFTGLYDELGLSSGSTSIEDFQGVPANAIDLGCVLNRSTPQLLLLGSDLPDRSSLEMNGAILSDYYVSIELDGTDMGSFCKAISWNGETNLTCELARCINVSVLPRMPDLRMYLGDLRSATPATEKFASPRPEIYSFGPSFIEDVETFGSRAVTSANPSAKVLVCIRTARSSSAMSPSQSASMPSRATSPCTTTRVWSAPSTSPSWQTEICPSRSAP